MIRQTRYERYQTKLKLAKTYPIGVCTVNFVTDENICFVIRAAACFGVPDVHVIGKLPDRPILKKKSASTMDYVRLYQYSYPSEFLSYVRSSKSRLVVAELTEDARPISELVFTPGEKIIICTGAETAGVTQDIISAGEVYYIPMPGPAWCANTSQIMNIMLYEYVRQIEGRK